MSLSRRTFLFATGAGAFSAIAGASRAMAERPGTAYFSGILVDVSPLRRQGYGIQSDWVEQDLILALKDQFLGRLIRNAPRLLVQVTSVSLGTFAGAREKTSDFMEGTALVLDKGDAVLAEYPILLALPTSSGGAWYLPDVDRNRVRSLSRAFAGWVERKTNR